MDAGEEATHIGSASALQPDDVVFAQYRERMLSFCMYSVACLLSVISGRYGVPSISSVVLYRERILSFACSVLCVSILWGLGVCVLLFHYHNLGVLPSSLFLSAGNYLCRLFSAVPVLYSWCLDVARVHDGTICTSGNCLLPGFHEYMMS